jgi:uncharacterized membrane-anchored protein
MTNVRLISSLLALVAAAMSPGQNPPDQKKGKGNEAAGKKGQQPMNPEDEKAARAAFEKELGAVPGPTVGKLTAQGKGVIAEIKVPAKHTFIPQPGAAKFGQLTGNPGGQHWSGVILMPDGEFMVFVYEPVGYIQDADKEKLDPDALMKTMKASEAEAGKQRKAMGGEALTLEGWADEPYYDPQTKNLTWAIKIKDESGHVSVNHRVKLLGREGVMSAVLVCSPEEFAKSKQTVNPLLAGYTYTPGNTYAEWKPGDKVAAYGLAGLIAGGAVFGAAKLGFLGAIGAFFAKFGKAAILFVIAAVAGVWKAITSIFGGRRRVDA